MVRGTVTGLSSGPVKVMDKALTCALPPPPLRHNLECARIQTADDMRASYPEIWVLFDHLCSARIHRKLPARLLSRCPCRLQVHEFIVTGFLDIAMSVFRTVGGNSSDLWAWIVGTFDEAVKPSRPHSVGLASGACQWGFPVGLAVGTLMMPCTHRLLISGQPPVVSLCQRWQRPGQHS